MNQKPILEINDRGVACWTLNGEFHNESGPAIVCHNGTKKWYQNGVPHNTKGPSVIWNTGEKKYHIRGTMYPYEEWRRLCGPMPVKVINTCKSKTEPVIFIL